MKAGPRTSIVNIYGKHSNHVALGGAVYNDVTGPTSRAGGLASYTYTFQVAETMNLALALQAGFTQFKLIKDNTSERYQNDPLMHEPGTKYLYSTHAWTLISLAIERGAKKPFAQFIDFDRLLIDF